MQSIEPHYFSNVWIKYLFLELSFSYPYWHGSLPSSYNIMRAKGDGKKFKNWNVASEASGNVLENIALFPQILASLCQIIYFLSRSEYLFPKSANPPPPQNQMVVPLLNNYLCPIPLLLWMNVVLDIRVICRCNEWKGSENCEMKNTSV